MDAREFRDVGHRVVDFLAEYLDHIEEKRVSPDTEPLTTNELFAEPLPQDPSTAEAVLNELETKLIPYCTNVGHPGYMGLITPSPNPVGVMADFICCCSALNQNVGAYSMSAVAMERRVARWLTDLGGYGPKAGGNLTSGKRLWAPSSYTRPPSQRRTIEVAGRSCTDSLNSYRGFPLRGAV